MKALRFVAVSLSLVFPACGGTELADSVPTGPNSPSSPSSPVFKATFNYDDSVSTNDRQVIENGVSFAQEFFERRLGVAVRGDLPVEVFSGGCNFGAQTVGNPLRIQICTSSSSWAPVGGTVRSKTVTHEMFHVLQAQNNWIFEWWSREGSAEYVGYAAVIDRGMISYQTIHNCQVDQFVNNGRQMIPLGEISRDTYGGYGLAWLAWDSLLGGMGGIGKLSRGLRGMDFDSAYGISRPAFEEQFIDYRRSLQPSRTAACNQLVAS